MLATARGQNPGTSRCTHEAALDQQRYWRTEDYLRLHSLNCHCRHGRYSIRPSCATGRVHDSIPSEATTDIKVRFYPQPTDPVKASSPADVKLRRATETIRLLRHRARGAIWELWTDGAVVRRTGAGVAQFYLGPDEPQP